MAGLITPLLGGLDRRAETQSRPKDWPICSTMASVRTGRRLAQPRPRFSAAKKALGAEDWNGAIAALELAALRDRLMAISRTTSAMLIVGCVSSGGHWPLSAGADAKSPAPQRA